MPLVASLLRLPVLAVVGLLALPAGASATQLVVDDDRVQCPGADETSIQAAVDALDDGDVVSICPGDYAEGSATVGSNGLRIPNDITLRGAGADQVTIRPRSTVAGDVINVVGAAADISGVTVRAGDTGGAEAGVAFVNASGSSLRNSRVTDIVDSAAGYVEADTGFGVVASPGASAPAGDQVLRITGNLIEGYNKGGIRIDSSPRDASDARILATISKNVVRGAGELNTAQPAQEGVRVRGGSGATITDNAITDNRYRDSSPARTSAGIRFDDADLAASRVTGNVIQDNVYGVDAVDAMGSSAGVGPVNAEGNYWGNPNGPSPDGGMRPLNETPLEGDYVSSDSVDSSPFLSEPPALGPAPAPQRFGPPTLSLNAPASAKPGDTVTVSTIPSDEIGVNDVTFRRGDDALPRTFDSATGRYITSFQVTEADAGTSIPVVATATTSDRRTNSALAGIRVPAPAPAPETRVETRVETRTVTNVMGRLVPVRLDATTTRRDRKAPYRFRTSGQIVLPQGVDAPRACGEGGTVLVVARGGRVTVVDYLPVRPDCRFGGTFALRTRRGLSSSGRLKVTVEYFGNNLIAPTSAKKRTVRVG